MSDPENFLSRWSRRKLDAEQEASPSARPRDPPTHKASTGGLQSAEALAKAESGDPESDKKTEPHTETTESAALDSRLRGNERSSDFADSKEPVFDLSTLPSLESITAETDVRVFLQKGVPADLTRAALRRAWTADPNIRDFMEVAENQWDFATGKDLPGFGPMRATDDIRQMLADIFGDGPKPPAEAAARTAPSTAELPEEAAQTDTADRAAEPPGEQDIFALPKDQATPEEAPAPAGESVMQRGEVNVVSQQNNRDDEYEPLPARRPHGRALPQ